jgi:hypothetical protein
VECERVERVEPRRGNGWRVMSVWPFADWVTSPWGGTESWDCLHRHLSEFQVFLIYDPTGRSSGAHL